MALLLTGGLFSSMRLWFLSALSPAQLWASGEAENIELSKIANFEDALIEISNLKQQLSVLQNQIQIKDVRIGEIERLVREYKIADTAGVLRLDGILHSRVIGRPTNWDDATLILNVGGKLDVRVGSGVVVGNGIIGEVIETGASVCRVALLSHPRTSIPVRVKRTGQAGVLRGKGRGIITLEYVERSVSLKKDDVIVTSGLAGIYAEGLSVGKIKSIDGNDKTPRDHEIVFTDVEVEATVDPYVIDRVIVLSRPLLPGVTTTEGN